MKKRTWIIIFYTIITFGFIWLKWKNKSKNHQKNTIYQENNLPFKIQTLINALKQENIIKITNTHYRVNITLKDTKIIDIQSIKALKGVRGLFLKSNSISITFEQYTAAVADALAKYIK
ncbi:PTS glucose transporter subunit IIB [Mycoplasma sp. 246B]